MIFQGIANAVTPRQKALNSVPSTERGWYPLIREAFAGAWQRNITVDRNAVLAYHAVFACVTLIASDIAKLPRSARFQRHLE
jgi:phage portal protein BeeE